MPNFTRLPVAAAALLLLAACSSEPAPVALDAALQQDLARVGSGVQLAGTAAPRLEVVSDVERTGSAGVARAERGTAAPEPPAARRAPRANLGTRAAVRSARRVTRAPAPVQPAVTEEVGPADSPSAEPAPEPTPSQQRPQRAPLPSTQREPVGGWRTPNEIIRNAPFPINPARSARW